MSSTFILMGLLVLAAFALGVLVGWLLGTSTAVSGDLSVRRPVRLRPMTRGLPDWDVEQIAKHSNGVEWSAADSGEVDDEAVETTMVLGPLSNGDSRHTNPSQSPSSEGEDPSSTRSPRVERA